MDNKPRSRLAKGLDTFAKGFGAAVADVRHKFEEFAWGRVVTSRAQNITIDTVGERTLAERFGWSVRGEQRDRAAEPGWSGRSFLPDATRAPEQAERAERHQQPDRGIDL